MTRVGVVTIAHGHHAHQEHQHRSLVIGTRQSDRYVVVAMADPGIGPVEIHGLESEVTRIGARSDGLPLAGPDLVAAYAEVVETYPDTVWSGPVTYLPPPPPSGYDLTGLDGLADPHPARRAPPPGELVTGASPESFRSLSFAVAASTWERLGGFCEDYVGYGGADIDWAFQLRAAGITLGWVGAARAYHQHHPVNRPPVEHVDAIVRNGRLFADRWGRWRAGYRTSRISDWCGVTAPTG